ncbi:MAG: rhodanese-related sulfurtransferase [Cyclobacteriaceae bacterium]|nr:rhodanese-related sulfurtransferase [Cyclobacteriaceae bacterium]MCB0500701.1 rhodanese-related sulfurtransferase [Cyclobacteriaceae bacterium]MCB9236575.1 rhodanese-related sulfurtransferase [Flammeovirgaceae bacterium]MCW5903240.1 rhodanese-related sulfurtransferase [Cyclobacteriaceae bacterium]HPI80912.1 rhodanese-related sulfurtransferase [Cyclobacteriaceae bacterium]
MALHNRIDKRILKNQLKDIPYLRKTLSFYKYHPIADPQAFRDTLYAGLDKLQVWGRIYVATEGINAQVSVPAQYFNDFKAYLDGIPFLANLRLNIAIDDDGKSFFKLKILVRKKIVADGLNDESFDASNSGHHLDAPTFNQLTEDPSTIIVDMRNHYESEIGHFKNAICPDVDTFRDALPVVEKMLETEKEKNVVMYCTGGIRCEKASAWFKHRGFLNVYQLEGGIIEYARQVKDFGLENKFVGKNFVFDERLGERVSEDIISVCHQCGRPCDTHTNCKNDGCHLLFIQCGDCAQKLNGCCSTECKDIIELPEEKQKALRAGLNKGRQVFKKGRSEKILYKASTQ